MHTIPGMKARIDWEVVKADYLLHHDRSLSDIITLCVDCRLKVHRDT